jgi:hypothetical protein
MDLNDVLLAVEKAAPVDAVKAVTRRIGVSLDALWVSFLVADMSGRALVRLVHVPIGDVSGARRQDEDVAVVLPFDGGPQEQALRAQRVLVEEAGGRFVVRAPVTQRGEAIGLLEMALSVAPTEAAVPRITVYEPFSPESLVYLYLPPHGGEGLSFQTPCRLAGWAPGREQAISR